jgi:hypothetical protein
MYWPMLLGRVPFPAKLVTQFPPWDSVRSTLPPPGSTPHAEMGDLVTELYPWKAYTRRAIASGTLPLWNPSLLLGAPFLGDLQTGLFYPLNLVYYALPTPLAWSLSILIRTMLAGLLATLLASALGASRTAALTAGVVFALCGWVTAFQTRPHLDTSLWLPLVLLSIDRLQRKSGGSSVVLAAAAFALPVLAGQPENAAHVTMVAAPPPPRSAARAERSAAPTLPGEPPTIATWPARRRARRDSDSSGLEVHLATDRGLTMPWGPASARARRVSLPRSVFEDQKSRLTMSAAYAGMLTLLLAPLAWLHPNRRDVLFFGGLLLCVLQIVYGTGPVYWLALKTPILQGLGFRGRRRGAAGSCR